MTQLIHRWEVTESKQYPGMFELTGQDGMLKRYYLASTPCGRICLREHSELPEHDSTCGCAKEK